jgi:poly(hydroxyalkanoate) granule associated protein phasin
MLDAMQKYVRAGLDALSSQRLPNSSRKARLDNVSEQVTSVTSAVSDWWQEAGSSLVREIKQNVVRQMEAVGFATKKDVETLRARLDRLEARGTTPPRTGRPGRATSRSAASGEASTTGRTKSAAGRSARTTPSPTPKRGRETPGRG